VHHSRVALLIGVGLPLAALTCKARTPDPTPEELSLARQVAGLRSLVAAAEQGRLVDFEQMLIVVDQGMVERLLSRVVPVEGDVGGGFRVRLDSARAAFRDGVALVHLAGEVRLVGRPASATMAVHGGLDEAELEPASGMLRSSVKVFAVEIPKADVLGVDEPVRKLTELLAEGGLETLIGPIRVPVRVADRLSLPPVRTERVRVAGLELPVEAEVSSLKAFGGKLWIGVRGRLPSAGRRACSDRTAP
jgi:hypothetical protein